MQQKKTKPRTDHATRTCQQLTTSLMIARPSAQRIAQRGIAVMQHASSVRLSTQCSRPPHLAHPRYHCPLSDAQPMLISGACQLVNRFASGRRTLQLAEAAAPRIQLVGLFYCEDATAQPCLAPGMCTQSADSTCDPRCVLHLCVPMLNHCTYCEEPPTTYMSCECFSTCMMPSLCLLSSCDGSG